MRKFACPRLHGKRVTGLSLSAPLNAKWCGATSPDRRNIIEPAPSGKNIWSFCKRVVSFLIHAISNSDPPPRRGGFPFRYYRWLSPPANFLRPSGPWIEMHGKDGQSSDHGKGNEVGGLRITRAIAAPHGGSMVKHSFADKGVPKCNLGTRNKKTSLTLRRVSPLEEGGQFVFHELENDIVVANLRHDRFR